MLLLLRTKYTIYHKNLMLADQLHVKHLCSKPFDLRLRCQSETVMSGKHYVAYNIGMDNQT